jgi:undecaprenyl-diphosphatase
MGIIEGLTEFLPVSSTGHLIIAGHFLGFTGDFAKTFEIAIQLGAILAVVVYFWVQISDLFFRLPIDPTARTFVTAIGLAFLPAAFVGLIAHGAIKVYLFNPITVGIALVIGGFAILIIESKKKTSHISQLEGINFKTAFYVGLAQCLALFPGVSRAGATIMGGLVVGMDRKTSAEFSFFLALPTMFAATLYDAFKNRALITDESLGIMLLGLGAAFVTAWGVIALFLAFIKRHSFKPFGYYRIVFGCFILFIFWSGFFKF